MLSLIKYRVSLISDIDSSEYLAIKNATDAREGPLRSVESHDGAAGAMTHVELVAGLGKPHDISVILIPGPAYFASITLDPHGGPVSTAAHCVHKELAHSERHLGAWSTLTHLDWEFIIDVTGPVQTFTIVRGDKALVALGGHHYNAIVRHI